MTKTISTPAECRDASRAIHRPAIAGAPRLHMGRNRLSTGTQRIKIDVENAWLALELQLAGIAFGDIEPRASKPAFQL